FFWGRLPNDRLAELVSKCRALVFPGYEDFGIVPVEAMAAGLPVVAFGQGGVTESVQQEHGILFPKQTVPSLYNALLDLGKKEFKTEALKARAKEFDVSRFRNEYKEAVRDASERHLAKR